MDHSIELQVLHEISNILDENEEIKGILTPILIALSRSYHSQMKRGAITLLNRDTKEILIEAAYGFTATQKRKGRYSLGEGITGEVVEQGLPVSIVDISKDPRYANKTGAEEDELGSKRVSFISVPIRSGKEVIGTLNITFENLRKADVEKFEKLLMVIASMLARIVKLRQELREENERLTEENKRLKLELGERYKPERIIGNSQVMQMLYQQIAQVSKSDATVLIRGESGTGKELVAQEIHDSSFRKNMPLIKVNCATFAEGLIESELFGHEKGSFTGAYAAKKGKFELANNGTIFLDEIGELPQAMQAKLLRVLQEKEFERVGGIKTIKVNVRILAATNRDLEKEVAEGTFREDLYYRLNVFPVHIPPLRERKSDITMLCDHFIEKYNRENNLSIKRLSTNAIDLLNMYHWPGNVRELENIIMRAVLLSRDDVIHNYHLPPSLQSAESSQTALSSSLQSALDTLEYELITDELKTTRGNRAKAARNLGISERIMGLRIEKYRIDPKRLK